MYILDQNNSVANHFLAQLRDVNVQGDRWRFRKNLERLGEVMAYEVSKKLDYHTASVQTPLGNKSSHFIAKPPVLIAVLRAALPFFQGFLNFFDDSDCGFIGAYRREEEASRSEVEVEYLYQAAPDLNGREVLLIDPMLATGKSFAKTIEQLVSTYQPKALHICSVIAAPEGIINLKDTVRFPFELWVGSVDEKLNDRFYIVPGLGDAGDLSFGPKL